MKIVCVCCCALMATEIGWQRTRWRIWRKCVRLGQTVYSIEIKRGTCKLDYQRNIKKLIFRAVYWLLEGKGLDLVGLEKICSLLFFGSRIDIWKGRFGLYSPSRLAADKETLAHAKSVPFVNSSSSLFSAVRLSIVGFELRVSARPYQQLQTVGFENEEIPKMLYQLMVFGCVCYYWHLASVYVAVFIFLCRFKWSFLDVSWMDHGRDKDVLLSIYLSVCLSICLSVYLSICLSIYLSICLSVYLSICLSVYLSIYLSVCLSICLSVYLSICLSIYLSVCLSICLSVYLSICLSVYLSIYLPTYPTYIS